MDPETWLNPSLGASVRIMPSCREVRNNSPSRPRLICRSAHDSEAASFGAFATMYPETTLLVDTYDTLEGVRKVIDLNGAEWLTYGGPARIVIGSYFSTEDRTHRARMSVSRSANEFVLFPLVNSMAQ